MPFPDQDADDPAKVPTRPAEHPIGERRVGPYTFLRPIGKGGMGEVFLARDTRLHREVAVKIITESDRDRAARGTWREARAAARLNHPGIAAVYDVLEVEHETFIVMEYVPGASLSDHLRTHHLEPAEVIRLGLQITEAVAHAHAAGIVHCDLKPANIRVTPDRSIKILDFGIARTVASDPVATTITATPTTSTLEGLAIGTPAYMSPEQMLGVRLDARTDVYSLGVILYEMIASRKPFEHVASLAPAVAAADAPRALSEEVPAALRSVVFKSLARNPGDRYASASELHTALEAIAKRHGPLSRFVSAVRARPRSGALAGMLLAVALVSTWFGISRRSQSGAASNRPDVVAILPFESIGGGMTTALATGLAEVLATDLSAVSGLSIVPRGATLQYAQDPKALQRVAADLAAHFVITGTVQSAGETLRITINLIDVTTGRNAWSGRFDGVATDVFNLEQQIARTVVERLGLVTRPRSTGAADPGRAVPPTSDFKAFEDYSQGRQFLDRRSETGNLDRAITLFESALARDPRFALSHAALGEALWAKYLAIKEPALIDRARQEATEALRLEPNAAAVRYTLALIYQGTGKRAEALDELQKGIAAQPDNYEFHQLLGEVYTGLQRLDDAVREFQAALVLRPGYGNTYRGLGTAYYMAGRYQEAVSAFKRVTELQPNSSAAFQRLGTAYQAIGDLPRALECYRRANEIAPSGSAWSNIAMTYYQQRRFTEALAAFQEAVRLLPHEPQAFRNLGDTFTRLNRRREATAAYNQAVELTQSQLTVNPRNADAMSLQALCLAKLGRFDEALSLAARASQAAPASGSVFYRASVVDIYAGRLDDALNTLQAAVAHGYGRQLLRDDDELTPVRGSPRFAQLMTSSER